MHRNASNFRRCASNWLVWGRNELGIIIYRRYFGISRLGPVDPVVTGSGGKLPLKIIMQIIMQMSLSH